MEIFAPIEKKISLDGIHFFQENFPTCAVCARSNKVLLSVFFFFLISAFIVEISSILKYQKRKASTASKIIEIFIHFQSRFPTNVFFLKAMLS